jgi:hypothetical protein
MILILYIITMFITIFGQRHMLDSSKHKLFLEMSMKTNHYPQTLSICLHLTEHTQFK